MLLGDKVRMTPFQVAMIPAIAALAVFSGISAAAEVWRVRTPERVLRILPHDPVATLVQADRELLGAKDPARVARAARAAAIAALEAQPLDPRALRVLALNALAAGDERRGFDLLKLSQRISRHDLGTSLALIEHYATTGDVGAALNQYDVALTANPKAEELLLPLLTHALSDPDIRLGLRRYVMGDRPWLRGFLNYAIPNASPPDDLAALIVASGGLPKHTDYREFETQLLQRLFAAHRYAALLGYFKSLKPDAAALLGKLSIDTDTTNPQLQPLTWYFLEVPDISAQPAEEGQASIRVASGAHGTAMQRVLYLRPGPHRFSGRVTFPDHDGGVNLQLSCMGEGGSRLIWNREAGPADQMISDAELQVPENCPVQMIAIGVSGGTQQTDIEILISDLSLS